MGQRLFPPRRKIPPTGGVRSTRPAAVSGWRRRQVDHRAILESADAIIYAHDLQGRFIYVNGPAAEALGFAAADAELLLGRSYFDVLPPHAVADAAVVMGAGTNRRRLGARRRAELSAQALRAGII